MIPIPPLFLFRQHQIHTDRLTKVRKGVRKKEERNTTFSNKGCSDLERFSCVIYLSDDIIFVYGRGAMTLTAPQEAGGGEGEGEGRGERGGEDETREASVKGKGE